MGKILDQRRQLRQYEQRLELKEKIEELIKQKYHIIYVDEAVATKSTYLKRDWSLLMKTFEIDTTLYSAPTTAFVAGISRENGVECVLYRERSIKTEDFIEFMKMIKRKYPFKKLVLFFDQLSVHLSLRVREYMEMAGWIAIVNAVAFCDGNPIEIIIGQVKHHFKKAKLQAIAHGHMWNNEELLAAAWKTVTKENCQKSV